MNAPLMWSCAHCGNQARATVHQMRHTYCSRECMAAAYSSRMSGADNPNFRAASEKLCRRCGGVFHSYGKSRIYCSSDCYRKDRWPQGGASSRRTKAARPVRVTKTCKACGKAFTHGKRSQPFCSQRCASLPGMKKDGPPRRPTVGKADITCLHCGAVFQAYKSSKRKFCSPKCHVDSGGPKRAGKEAIVARLKYGPKKDANHNELMAVIREHVPAKDTSALGNGFPDGIAWINGGWHLFDIKNPATSYGKKGLNPIQKKWADTWTGGPVFLIHSEIEARLFAQGRFDDLVKYPDDRVCIGSTDACLSLLRGRADD